MSTDRGTNFCVKFCSFSTEINKGKKEKSIFVFYSLHSQRAICGEMRRERDIWLENYLSTFFIYTCDVFLESSQVAHFLLLSTSGVTILRQHSTVVTLKAGWWKICLFHGKIHFSKYIRLTKLKNLLSWQLQNLNGQYTVTSDF